MDAQGIKEQGSILTVVLDPKTHIDICTELVEEHTPTSNEKRHAMSDKEKQALWALANCTNLSLYSTLHQDGRRFIWKWFDRAAEQKDCLAEESFEPFICAWIAFNGWASRVTGEERDINIVKALSLSDKLCSRFMALVRNDTKFSVYAQEFQSLWPVFSARDLRKASIRRPVDASREEIVAFYLKEAERISKQASEDKRHAEECNQKARQHREDSDEYRRQAEDFRDKAKLKINYSPRCSDRHRRESGIIPLDWPHTLTAIYQVRCNLFHGEKARNCENDQRLVHAAFRVLIHFLNDFPQAWTIGNPDGSVSRDDAHPAQAEAGSPHAQRQEQDREAHRGDRPPDRRAGLQAVRADG